MTEYRRIWSPGATWFFTVNLANRQSRLLVDNIETLRASFLHVRETHPFQTIAMVVMPEHIHALWVLPSGDTDFAVRWRLIKAGFSHRMPVVPNLRPSLVNKRERGIWQRRYWEHRVRNEDDMQRHMDYIHFNPVKHGHVCHAKDWPYSTFHRYVDKGWLPKDWGVASDSTGDYGEPA